MSAILTEILTFSAARLQESRRASQTAAFRLVSGVDLDKAMLASPAEREVLVLRLQRLLERERLRGWRRHWSYDLNRHIALAEAIRRLASAEGLADPANEKDPRQASCDGSRT